VQRDESQPQAGLGANSAGIELGGGGHGYESL
jgi:hypothetical protein